MSSDSVKVCDRELEKLGDLAKCWDDVSSILDKYVQTLKSVSSETIKEGHIHDAIDNLRFYAQEIQKYANGLGASAAGSASKLASVAEKVDLNLYNEV